MSALQVSNSIKPNSKIRVVAYADVKIHPQNYTCKKKKDVVYFVSFKP